MSSNHEDSSFSSSDLGSPAYRRRLLRKLNTLIAVLEVACAKVERSLKSPDADLERLVKIQDNLTETLGVCQRARQALYNREELPQELPSALGVDEVGKPDESLGSMSGSGLAATEQSKFSHLGPITRDEIRSVDLDDLCDRLAG